MRALFGDEMASQCFFSHSKLIAKTAHPTILKIVEFTENRSNYCDDDNNISINYRQHEKVSSTWRAEKGTNSSVIRQKSEFKNGGYKKTKQA